MNVTAKPVRASLAHLDAMRRSNEAAVLATVSRLGPISRAEIGERTGLSAASVTKMATRLLDCGLVREQPEPLRTSVGRPRMPLTVAPDAVCLGVHIGAVRATVSAVALDGRVVDEINRDHDSLHPRDVAAAVGREVRRLSGRLPRGHRSLGIGVSIGGWVDRATGRVLENDQLGWRDVPLLDLMRKRVAGPLHLRSAVQCMALAELWFGVGRQAENFLFLFIGNYLGAVLIVDGRLVTGYRGLAGAIEHLTIEPDGPSCRCGQRGCLTTLVTDSAILRQAADAGLSEVDTVDELVALARRGNRRARRVITERSRNVGRAVAILADLLDPQYVVLAGAIPRADDFLVDLREEVLRRLAQPGDLLDRIAVTGLDTSTRAVAGAVPALEAVFADPVEAMSQARHEATNRR